MEPMLDPFEQVCRQISFAEPRIPLISNLYGREVTSEIATADVIKMCRRMNGIYGFSVAVPLVLVFFQRFSH